MYVALDMLVLLSKCCNWGFWFEKKIAWLTLNMFCTGFEFGLDAKELNFYLHLIR